jgi:hypothetical protein
MNMSTNSKLNRNSHDLKLMAGFRKHGKGLTFNVGGKKYTTADILRLLQGRIDVGDGALAAKAAFHAAIAAEHDEVDRTEALLGAICQTLLITLAASPETLADFGLVPRKSRRTLTVKEKSAAVEQAHATRLARHTLGQNKQRLVRGSPSPPAHRAAAVTGAAV